MSTPRDDKYDCPFCRKAGKKETFEPDQPDNYIAHLLNHSEMSDVYNQSKLTKLVWSTSIEGVWVSVLQRNEDWFALVVGGESHVNVTRGEIGPLLGIKIMKLLKLSGQPDKTGRRKR